LHLDIKELREKIDDVDEDIVNLINKRTELVLEIGKQKSKTSDSVYAPHREKMIIDRIKELNPGPFPDSILEVIYKEIMSACRTLEKPTTIAYLGPRGSFGHVASIKHFGSSATYIPIQHQMDIFIEVEAGRADYGVVAIENTTEGVVRETLDMFFKSDLQICAEILLPISHNLLSNSPVEKIKRIYSHRQAFPQCREWLRNNLRHVEQLSVSSTSEAAKRASEEEGVAAIASKLAADIYGVGILVECIADDRHNMTRFFVIGKHTSKRSGDDKTSAMFSVKDKVGALWEVLGVFVQYSLNLSKLESRPSRAKAWEYVFFVDVDGHIEDEIVKKAFDEVSDACVSMKILGSYPKANF